MERHRENLRVRHDARRRITTDAQWMKRLLRFHGIQLPKELGIVEVNAFLSHLAAVELQVSASTQHQALAAVWCLFRGLLGQDPAQRAQDRKRLPGL
ncbi:MAG: site-specific integrase [Cyanobium sp.]